MRRNRGGGGRGVKSGGEGGGEGEGKEEVIKLFSMRILELTIPF